MEDFKRFFIRGLAALVPTLLTVAILVWAYSLVSNYVGRPINYGLRTLCAAISPEPSPGLIDEDADPIKYGTPINEWDHLGRRLTIEHKSIHHPALHLADPALRKHAMQARSKALWLICFAKYRIHLLGFLIAIVLVYFTGLFLASFIGRASWRAAEGLIGRIPLIRPVYANVKQVTDFLLSDKPVAFSGVVAVQYPRKGVWSLGLSTGAPIERLQEVTEEELVTVFIPSSPTPVTGYVVQVPRKDVVELNMTIDEGLRFTISGGVIKPDAVLPSQPSSKPKKP